ncbi:MAG: fatty acid kinase [Cryptosporangiaceae bacterium]|nr:fatty acid kinase [Cryptosporangiaceae bacterium]
MLTSLDDAAARRWCAAGVAALRLHQREIDELNVYPVPDGDTGTNLLLTLTSAAEALAAEPPVGAPSGPGRALRAMARGALLGARGNSGVIVSQLLRGMADTLTGPQPADGAALAGALNTAAEACYEAVAEPAEGTILSVARGAARTAQAAADRSGEALAVAIAAAGGAAEALAETPRQLEALARAGVVDAGGRGLVVLLDALAAVLGGSQPETAPLARVTRDPGQLVVPREAGSPEFGYEVQYLLDASPDAVDVLRAELRKLGDSVVIVGAGADPELDLWNVHAHVNDVGAAIEAGVEAGRPHRISVTRFAEASVPALVDPGARALVAVSPGAGLTALFSAEGAVVVAGGPGAAPSTGQLLAAIRATGAGSVVVLPNDSNVRAAATAAAEQARAAGQEVSVVHTKSPVQALAALAVRDPRRHHSEDVIAMAEAAAATRWAEVTVAVREALTVAGTCQPGDVLGLVEGEVVLIATDLLTGASELLDRMLGGGGELVTLVTGAGAPDGFGERLSAHLSHRWPFVECQVYEGGQPHYPLLAGVE